MRTVTVPPISSYVLVCDATVVGGGALVVVVVDDVVVEPPGAFVVDTGASDVVVVDDDVVVEEVEELDVSGNSVVVTTPASVVLVVSATTSSVVGIPAATGESSTRSRMPATAAEAITSEMIVAPTHAAANPNFLFIPIACTKTRFLRLSHG
jgi:hypothetical protein